MSRPEPEPTGQRLTTRDVFNQALKRLKTDLGIRAAIALPQIGDWLPHIDKRNVRNTALGLLIVGGLGFCAKTRIEKSASPPPIVQPLPPGLTPTLEPTPQNTPTPPPEPTKPPQPEYVKVLTDVVTTPNDEVKKGVNKTIQMLEDKQKERWGKGFAETMYIRPLDGHTAQVGFTDTPSSLVVRVTEADGTEKVISPIDAGEVLAVNKQTPYSMTTIGGRTLYLNTPYEKRLAERMYPQGFIQAIPVVDRVTGKVKILYMESVPNPKNPNSPYRVFHPVGELGPDGRMIIYNSAADKPDGALVAWNLNPNIAIRPERQEIPADKLVMGYYLENLMTIVPFVPDGILKNAQVKAGEYTVKTEGEKVLAVDAKNNVIARGIDLKNVGWTWVGERSLEESVSPYLAAFGTPTGQLAEKVKETIRELVPKEGTSKDGKPFYILVTKDSTPLLIATKNEKGEWGWTSDVGRILFQKNGIDGGTEFTGWWLNNSEWQQVIGEHFTLATIDYGIYWNEIEPNQGQFNFSIADKQVRLAEGKQMRIRGMGLVFPPMYPDWLRNFQGSPEDFEQALRNHISTIVSHFSGKVNEWTVVTEPYIRPYRQNDILYQKFGYDYIEIAFQEARQADPEAILIYEDTFNHTSNGITTSLTRDIVSRLQLKGLIDRVGLEMHIDASQPLNVDDIVKTMQSYGVSVSVTSVDVDLSNVGGTTEEKYQLQAEIYAKILKACLDSSVCTDFSVWGIGDKNHWLDQQNADADPTPFDDNLNPKPAFWAMMQVLSENLTP